ncbi:hypothetical protein [Rhizobium leucaenae]|uniref:hypothetical protein n=1 Tax=Rhizobium leucaenae TaxID=29450 RepID=UPI00161C0C2C|nr:hypothetical protein [Rhizobium leucaenae]MBB6299886.1 hypothetical protein [Rhizobium leucaenae]
MVKIDDGGAAFPRAHETKDFYGRTTVHLNSGMSLRDYAAIKAMAGALAGEPGSHLEPARLAHDSYAYADAMLAARKKES